MNAGSVLQDASGTVAAVVNRDDASDEARQTQARGRARVSVKAAQAAKGRKAVAADEGQLEQAQGRPKGQKGRAAQAAAEGQLEQPQGRKKGSKEERKLAAEAERQRRAELELLLMDDTALRDAPVAGDGEIPLPPRSWTIL